MIPFAVILPAAGASSRFGGARNKLLEDLDGQPVIVRTVSVFLARLDVSQIVIPTNIAAELRAILPEDSRIIFCAGGATRAESVWNALRQVAPELEWVAVHDAARPLVSWPLIDRVLAVAVEHGAAVPALPVWLTIKRATGPLPAKVERTVPRDRLWAMQTPQIARREALLQAFETCPIPLAQVTDDVQLIELAGSQVWLVPGEERNLKITTPIDLRIAKMWLEHPS